MLLYLFLQIRLVTTGLLS